VIFTSDLEPIFVEEFELLSVAIEGSVQGTYNTIDQSSQYGEFGYTSAAVQFSQNDHDGDGFVSLRLTAGNLVDDTPVSFDVYPSVYSYEPMHGGGAHGSPAAHHAHGPYLTGQIVPATQL